MSENISNAEAKLRLIKDCERAAEFYRQKPGLVQPATIVDLYETIARLAHVVQAKKG